MKIIIILVVLSLSLYSCEDIEKGYIDTENAEFTTDTLYIFFNPATTDSIPYQSENIQGISGTFPIKYEIADVKDTTGAIVPVEISSQIRVILNGIFEIQKTHTIPIGIYTIDLKVSNIHGSVILPRIFTIVVLPLPVNFHIEDMGTAPKILPNSQFIHQ